MLTWRKTDEAVYMELHWRSCMAPCMKQLTWSLVEEVVYLAPWIKQDKAANLEPHGWSSLSHVVWSHVKEAVYLAPGASWENLFLTWRPKWIKQLSRRHVVKAAYLETRGKHVVAWWAYPDGALWPPSSQGKLINYNCLWYDAWCSHQYDL